MPKCKPTSPQNAASFHIETSLITCPKCGFQKQEIMPETGCQYAYTCASCRTKLTTLPNNCCVYCSYGSTPCPPKQLSGADCCG